MCYQIICATLPFVFSQNTFTKDYKLFLTNPITGCWPRYVEVSHVLERIQTHNVCWGLSSDVV